MSDAPRAAIHDLGYKRYLGTRRPQSTRWRVIVKNVVGTSWRGWWRMKMWVIGAILTTVGIGIPMYLTRDKMFQAVAREVPVLTTYADALVPTSFTFLNWYAFVLATTVAAGAVARDLRASAFEFYFSRPVRPLDYVIGKVGGVVVVLLCVIGAGPTVLALLRVALSDNSDEVMAQLALVPRIALAGVVSALAFAVVPLALSTLAARPRLTITMWVGFYFLFGITMEGIAFAVRAPALAALSLPEAVAGLAHGLHGAPSFMGPTPPTGACAASLVGYTILGLVILYWRVRSAERAGMGGG